MEMNIFSILVSFVCFFFSLTELCDFALGLGEGFADLGGGEMPTNCGSVRRVLSSWGADNASEGGKPEEQFWVLV